MDLETAQAEVARLRTDVAALRSQGKSMASDSGAEVSRLRAEVRAASL